MFPELEAAYKRSIEAGLKPEGNNIFSFWSRKLKPNSFRRDRVISTILDITVGYEMGESYLDRLSDEELKRLVQNIQIVQARERHLWDSWQFRQKPDGWQTTDPNSHDPDNFRYIVHALNVGSDMIKSLQTGNPEALNYFLQRKGISCSLIDEVHRDTFMHSNGLARGHGLILDVPQENIVAVHYADMGKYSPMPYLDLSDNEIEEILQPYVDLKKQHPDAQSFFAKTGCYYNEVVVSRAKVAGVFLKSDPFLNLPLDEVYSRLGLESLRAVHQFQRWGLALDNESDIIGSQPLSGDLFYAKRFAGSRLQEAQEIARLLNIPLVLIPAPNYSISH